MEIEKNNVLNLCLKIVGDGKIIWDFLFLLMLSGLLVLIILEFYVNFDLI